jgi:hypothetical protein
MSLINDMLKDLDADNIAKASQPLPTGLRSLNSKPATKRSWILPALAALAVIYALVVELNILGIMPEKSTPPVEIPKPIALNSKWLEQSPATQTAEPVALEKIVPLADSATPEPAALAPAATTSTDSAEIPVADAEPSFADLQEVPEEPLAAIPADMAVEKLLQAGELALRDKRLTTPAGDNAYQYFKSALLLQPENPSARAGIAQIQQTYLGWLDQALLANRPEAARQHWLSARAAGVAPDLLADYESRFNSAATDAGAPAAAELPVRQSFSRVRSQSSDDATAAARLLRDGLVLGEAQALYWLEQGAPVEQTAIVLTDFYAAQGEPNKLLYLQQLLSGRGSSAAVYAQAQLAARQRNFQGAAMQLAAVTFAGPAEERRLRTLAGFYQQLKNYAEALPIYSELVSRPSGNVNDWLGLAVSADAQQMTSVAQNAFLQVLHLTHPDPRVMAFARQRHQDLSFSSSR